MSGTMPVMTRDIISSKRRWREVDSRETRRLHTTAKAQFSMPVGTVNFDERHRSTMRDAIARHASRLRGHDRRHHRMRRLLDASTVRFAHPRSMWHSVSVIKHCIMPHVARELVRNIVILLT